jgi:threonine aldolase
MKEPRRYFASDNNAVVHPEIMAAIQAANVGHAWGYGDDEWTARAAQVFKRHFGDEVEMMLVFNGTGANIVALSSILRSYEAVLCSAQAHLHVDECGALERASGSKVIVLPDADGKLTVEALRPYLEWRGDVHHSQPRVLSITNATELGTVYRPDETRALADFCHANGMLLHVDGARICNAAAAQDLPLRALTADCGVDVLSFGGTKNGLMQGEAVVWLTAGRFPHAPFVRKQLAQLGSKMRFSAAQLIALLEGDLWLRNARHANAMACLLRGRLEGLSGVRISRPVEANAVFARIPKAAVAPLQERFHFYVWDPAATEVRWMCAYDTTEDDVMEFAEAIKHQVGRQA